MIGLKEVAFYKWVIFDAFVHKAIAEWSLPSLQFNFDAIQVNAALQDHCGLN